MEEPATRPKFAGNPGDSDRLACAPHHRGDGTVHLGLLWQCSEGPCSSNRNESQHWYKKTKAKLNLALWDLYLQLFQFRCSGLGTAFEMREWGLLIKRRKGFLAPGEKALEPWSLALASLDRDTFSAVWSIDTRSTYVSCASDLDTWLWSFRFQCWGPFYTPSTCESSWNEDAWTAVVFFIFFLPFTSFVIGITFFV